MTQTPHEHPEPTPPVGAADVYCESHGWAPKLPEGGCTVCKYGTRYPDLAAGPGDRVDEVPA